MKKSFLSYFVTTTALTAIALPLVGILPNNSNTTANANTSTPPSTMTLTGTVRDFKMMYPDFERNSSDPAKSAQQKQLNTQLGGSNFSFGLDQGIVQTNLGSDGKPVFNGKTKSTTTKENFDRWYRDVPCANNNDFMCNASMSFPITLTYNPTTKIYTYDNSSFFPINGKLFGNQDNTHNYHFTYELKTKFTYQRGQTFKFTGDDDLLVFINGVRVIDLGGVHGAMSQDVNLDKLGLTPGKTYDFALFFAERHRTASNFRIDTSIAFEQPYWD